MPFRSGSVRLLLSRVTHSFSTRELAFGSLGDVTEVRLPAQFSEMIPAIPNLCEISPHIPAGL
jgi:hypothetical protein